MSEHHGSITVNAPLHQVYTFFTHFNDFPKFMSFVKEVTYYDDQRSHWVAQIGGSHEWDAINEAWIPDQQVGWRSVNGPENRGLVKFTPMSETSTRVDTFITYNPPAGIIGQVVDRLGFDNRFDQALEQDLKNFATMVEQAPVNALDPMQSHYLFHDESAIVRHTPTTQQAASMSADPMMSTDALEERAERIQREQQAAAQDQQQQTEAQQRLEAERERISTEQTEILRRQTEQDQKIAQQMQTASPEQIKTTPHPVFDTIGGRNASRDRTAFGDHDARAERFPSYHEDPMLGRAPGRNDEVSSIQQESPWRSGGNAEQPGDTPFLEPTEGRPTVKQSTNNNEKASSDTQE
ncbi:MAG TPA: SRPBCC family protein [Dictyobacter sp.]|jgi:hypothetical protein|nr:SRPBCC family protein [Dictyobacter sp.]